MNARPEEALAQVCGVLRRENAALAALDFPAATRLLAEKRQALQALEAARPASLPPGMRDRAAELAGLATENRRLLERAIAVQGRVLEVISRAARAQTPASRYGARGAIAGERKAAPIAFSARA